MSSKRGIRYGKVRKENGRRGRDCPRKKEGRREGRMREEEKNRMGRIIRRLLR